MWSKDIVKEISSWVDLKSLIYWSRVNKYYYESFKVEIYNRIKAIPKRLVCYMSTYKYIYTVLYIGGFPDGSQIDRDTDGTMIVDMGPEWFVTTYYLDLDYLPRDDLFIVEQIRSRPLINWRYEDRASIPTRLILDGKTITLRECKPKYTKTGRVVWGSVNPVIDQLHEKLPRAKVVFDDENYDIIFTSFIVLDDLPR